MNRLEAVRLVAGREVRERVRGRAAWIVTAVTALMAVALIWIPTVVSGQPKPTVVALVGPQAQALAPILGATAKAAGVDVTIRDLDTDAEARSALTPATSGARRVGIFARFTQAFSAGKAAVDVAVRLDPGGAATLEVDQALDPATGAVIRAAVNLAHHRAVLAQAGVPPAVVAGSEVPPPTTTLLLHPQPPDRAGRAIAAIAAGILIYVAMGLLGATIAGGVAQEKTTRTAELLLAAVNPADLMTGKVLGIGAVGLVQMALIVGAALVTNLAVHNAAVPSVIWILLPGILLWFVLGFAFYSFAFAAAGAMVARQEEVQLVTAPLTVLLIGAFLLVYGAIATPSAPWVVVLSYVPPLTPILMPARLALGNVAPWETPVAAVLVAVAAYGVARLAGRIYRAGLVRGGPRLSWAAALRLKPR